MLQKLFQRILVLSVVNVIVFGADPCFDIGPDPITGGFALCLQEELCITEPVAENACPSYASDYSCCYHHVFPGREHRGVWIASVTNIDWPRSRTSSVATQQEELRFLVNQIADAGLNAIYFQVRPAGDALYQSDIEPWSLYLTGSQGTAPSPLWDPLAYVIDLCKPLNIQVHAWINPYRASLTPNTNGLAPNHMAIQFPECAYPYSTYLWMDPGCEVVKNRTYNVAIDLVTRYDLDGIHLDDYFFPYPADGWTFPDQRTYNEYLQSGGTLGLDDWRRDSVNTLIQRLNVGIHETKPWVVFSISPFGIYRPGHPDGMPPPIAGFDQYSEIYCDAKLWLKEGWVDVLQPQLYWKIDPPAQSYPILLDWWVGEGQNPKSRCVYAGNYLTRVDIDAWSLGEIRAQIDISRESAKRSKGSWGNVQFSAKMFRDDFGGTVGFFGTFIYPLPALQPVMGWLSNATYVKVESMRPVVLKTKERSVTISVGIGDRMNIFPGVVHQVTIYKEINKHWSLYKVIPIQDIDVKNQIVLNGLLNGNHVVTFVNRIGQESQKTFFHVS